MSEAKNGVTWDLSEYFQEFDSSERHSFQKELKSDHAILLRKLRDVDRLGPETVSDWETLLVEAEDVVRRLGHLSSYLECLTAAHADREEYGLANAALERLRAEFRKIEV